MTDNKEWLELLDQRKALDKGKKAASEQEAWDIQETYAGKPHGWIQWQGTEVCMDVWCKCGERAHIDAPYAFYVKCSSCGTVYKCNGHIELIELEYETQSDVIETGRDYV